MSSDQNDNSPRIHKARVIGLFFILAFLLYGVGRTLFESEAISQRYAGTALIIANSIVVLFIGIWLRKTLAKYTTGVGNVYLLCRVVEAIALATIVLNTIPEFNMSMEHGYFAAMLALGLGSIPMCLALRNYTIAPTWLAVWGAIGYAFLALGFLLEFLGKPWSMYLLAPGGLWEVTFAVWLIIGGGKESND